MGAPDRPPVALVILDGWGCAEPGPGNGVELAGTPVFDRLWRTYPHTTLTASGTAVGLPAGQMGNSEVGHLNLGAGRIVYQDLERIDRAVEDGSLATRPALVQALADAHAHASTLHIMGLLSEGGVHSHLAHVRELVRASAAHGIRRIAVHAFTDGRDVSPEASLTDIPRFEEYLRGIEQSFGCTARVVSVMGRYWSMDRDNRWDRTQRAWDLLVHGRGSEAASASAAVEAAHAAGTTDEFIEPCHVRGTERLTIGNDDVVLFANFRPDRTRQLCHAFVDQEFVGFTRDTDIHPRLVTMTEYDPLLNVPVLFAPNAVDNSLADVIEAQGCTQLHVAETEKYPHVTYFFNGGREPVHVGERRIVVDSPRDVATYDLKPEMSAQAARSEFCEAFASDDVCFGIINFANPDMVGHTGVIPAVIRAVETVDGCLGDVVDTVLARGGTCLVTADHGNAEQMLTAGGKPHTAHTTNPVPCILVSPVAGETNLREGGILGDIAPTILDLLGVEQPAEMTGSSLLQRSTATASA